MTPLTLSLQAEINRLRDEKSQTIAVLDDFKCALGDDFAMGWWFEQGQPLLDRLTSPLAPLARPKGERWMVEVVADWDMYRVNDTIHFHATCEAIQRSTTKRQGRWTFADGKSRRHIEQAIYFSDLKRCKKCFPDSPIRWL